MNGDIKRGRPEKLTDDLKEWIVKFQQTHKKKYSANALRKEMFLHIANQVDKEIADRKIAPKNGDGRKAEIESRLPGLSSIQKFLKPPDKDNQDRINDILKLDKTWNIAATPELSAEAISVMLIVKAWMKDKHWDWLTKFSSFADKGEVIDKSKDYDWESALDKILKKSNWELSIREATWASRLYKIYIDHNLKTTFSDDPAVLWEVAKGYADKEKYSLIAGIKPDTLLLDNMLIYGLHESDGRDTDTEQTEYFHDYAIKEFKGGETK